MTRPDPALLADLDAGLLDPAQAQEVRAAALTDPRSAAVLDALRATRADLAALPALTVPPEIQRRWITALAADPDPAAADGAGHGSPRSTPAEDPGRPTVVPARIGPGPAVAPSHASGQPGESGIAAAPRPPSAFHPPGGSHRTLGRHGTSPSRRGMSADHPPPSGPGRRPQAPPGTGRPRVPRSTRRRVAVTSLLAAAALVVGVVVAVLGDRGSAVEVTRVELAAVARSTVGVSELGVYADVSRREACLVAAGHRDAEVLGGRPVRFDGSPGVLLVLSTGVLGRFRVLVVDDTCRTLADEVVGR